ncbi:MAG: HAD family hydrolase [Algibacter sp.]
MDLSKIKLIATDMDGTLLNSNHKVSDRFFNLFKSLIQHDILFVAASGRPYYSILEKLNDIKNDITIVAENGGLVIKNETVLLSTPINKNKLQHIVSKFDDLSAINAIFCTQNKAYFKINDADLLKTLTEFYPNFKQIDSTEEINETIIKIALYHNECSETHIYPHFKDLDGTYGVKVSGKNWVDISDNLANKGHAIKILQKNHNITAEETLTFGDYNNDIEMLKQSTYSFAMENAHQNVKDIANFKTKSNDEFGVELILEKLLEAKEALQLM